MALYKYSELLHFLNSIGAAPKKSLSQNFLVDGNIVENIVRKANILPEDTVLEIGPGPGVLTEALVKTGCRIIAVEKDRLFAEHLPRLGAQIQVIEGDFLEQDLRSLVPPKTKVVANLPYNLTSPILEKLFLSGDLFDSLLLMVQKEVAERIVANPGSEQYGALTVFCQFFTRPEIAIKVKASCFHPSPKVDSAVVLFKIKETTHDIDKEKFFHFVKSLFSFRRKMISSSLKRMGSSLDALEKVGLKGTERCETLSLDQLISLFLNVRIGKQKESE
jgi:dimethyladenosine transferase